MLDILFFGMKKLGMSFIYKIKKRWDLPIKPKFINFIVTYCCNARCVMCDVWRRYKKNPELEKRELSLEEIKDFLESNRDFLSEVAHIGLSGGEPFLREDLVEIVRAIRSSLPHTATGPQTNGLMPELIRKQLKEMKAIYNDLSLAVSLDGIGKTHDRIRGVKGAYDKVLRTIQYAQEIGLTRVTSGMTVGNLNYREIGKVREIVEKYGCESSCFLADTGERFYNIGRRYNLRPEARKSIIEELTNFSYQYYMDNLKAILEGKKKKRTLPCYSGYTSLVIDPYGNVHSCILRPEVFGNIREKPLKEILYSRRAKEIKKKLKGCTCWNQCEVSTSAVIDIIDVLKWFLRCSDKKRFFDKVKSIKKGII